MVLNHYGYLRPLGRRCRPIRTPGARVFCREGPTLSPETLIPTYRQNQYPIDRPIYLWHHALMARTKQILLRVSEEEFGKLKDKAEARGLSMSSWLRFAGLGYGAASAEPAAGPMSAEERYNAWDETVRRQNEQNAQLAGGRRY
jgi:hypothetical protein